MSYRVCLSLLAMRLVVCGGVAGTCGFASPSPVPDCENADMGTCGNACCKLLFHVEEPPEVAVKMLNESFSGGGADGAFTLQPTAEHTLGFADLRPFKIPSGEEFIGQVHHVTDGPNHYVDVIDFNIKPLLCGKGCSGAPIGSFIKAFSLSLVGGALGDSGQNYKNIIMAMKAVPWKAGFQVSNADLSCRNEPAPAMLI